MKPGRIKADQERRDKAKFRKWVRLIPDNAKLRNILIQFDGPFQRDWYYYALPYLKFKPLPLEELLNGL